MKETKEQKLKKDIKSLEGDLTIVSNALRFYSNRANWTVTKRLSEVDRITFFSSDIAEDNGQKARITLQAILTDRKHKKLIESSQYTYTDDQLQNMGYQIMMLADGQFLLAQAPKREGDLFLFAGMGLKFGNDLSALTTFENKQLARIAISNYINRGAMMIKNKPKEKDNGDT